MTFGPDPRPLADGHTLHSGVLGPVHVQAAEVGYVATISYALRRAVRLGGLGPGVLAAGRSRQQAHGQGAHD